ncbi:unnamed protein product [Arctogadus glacialis]
MRSSYTCLTKKNLAMEAQRKSKRKRQPTRDLGRVEKAMAESAIRLEFSGKKSEQPNQLAPKMPPGTQPPPEAG